MSRCAACGSKSVAYGTKNEGFSVGKAVAGTIFFGPVGAGSRRSGQKEGILSLWSLRVGLRIPYA